MQQRTSHWFPNPTQTATDQPKHMEEKQMKKIKRKGIPMIIRNKESIIKKIDIETSVLMLQLN